MSGPSPFPLPALVTSTPALPAGSHARLSSSADQHETQLSLSGLGSPLHRLPLPATHHPPRLPTCLPTSAGSPLPPSGCLPSSSPLHTGPGEAQDSDTASLLGQGLSRPTCPQPPGRGTHLQCSHLKLRVHSGQPSLALLSSHVVEEAAHLVSTSENLQLRMPALSFHPGAQSPAQGPPAAQAPKPICAPAPGRRPLSLPKCTQSPGHRYVSEGTFANFRSAPHSYQPLCGCRAGALGVLTFTRNQCPQSRELNG